uniref:hypothetical protein n=1 Tax=Segatella hominis TaxID=2518605 RepID=UPI004025AC0A
MLNGQLYINGKDAYLTWGIFLDETALSTLMTPAPNKEFISNKYRSKDGKSVIKHNPRLDEREITLPFNMTAKDSDTFMMNYAKFCEEVLAKGELVILTRFQPNVWYRCIYLSCTQFSQFIQEMAKFSLKLNEPDPSDRGETSKYASL